MGVVSFELLRRLGYGVPTIKTGSYRIYSITYDGDNRRKIYLGRIAVGHQGTQIVEARGDLLADMLPDGPIGVVTHIRWARLIGSAYFDVVDEGDW